MTYHFDKPEGVKGYDEEYIVVPFFALLGSIGGNLGMFIEFPPFSGLVTIPLMYIGSKCIKFKHGGKLFHAML